MASGHRRQNAVWRGNRHDRAFPKPAAETPPPGTDRRNLILLSPAAVAAAAVPGWAQREKKPFAPEELDQMMAPIALYRDSLLSQILMASGYPLEIVECRSPSACCRLPSNRI